MKTVLQIAEDVITIGDDENNTITEARRIDFNFEPKVGDKVNIFNNEKKMIITKLEIPTKENPQDKIHINIVNENKNEIGRENYPMYLKNVVNKVIYIVLAIFLGWIGVHKFYSGKIGMGILYLIFSWTGIPGIIGFIEGIIACFKKSDSNGNIVV